MNSNHPTFSSPEINPYAPPKAPIGEAVTLSKPSDLAETKAIRCITSFLLGTASIILSFLMLGILSIAILQFPWRVVVTIRTDRLVVLFGLLGLPAVLGGLGLWLVRAEWKASRSNSLGAAAVRFCFGGLMGTVLDAMVLSTFMVYRWLA